MNEKLNELVREPDFDDMSVEPEVVELLYTLVCSTRPAIIAETGTHKGFSSTCMALANPEAKIYTFDIVDFEAKNLWEKYEVTKQIQFYLRKGDDIPKEIKNVNLLFLDSDHSTENCLSEWKAWKKRLASGGIVLLHDTLTDPRKMEALKIIAKENKLSFNLATPRGLGVVIWNLNLI